MAGISGELTKYHSVLSKLVESQKSFRIITTEAVNDKERQEVFDENTSRLDFVVRQAKLQYSNLELARKRAGYIRHKAINGLEKYLIEFEANLERNGGKVIWALDAQEAVNEIYGILKKNGIKEVTKSKSLLADEINLNEEFKRLKILYNEVNPGEFILGQFDEPPRHASSFLINKNFSQIRELLHTKFNLPLKYKVSDSLNFIRDKFREKFEQTSASITGANYLIADTGSVCISEDSGDAIINSVVPKIQIIIAGIDKVIPSLMNLDVLIPLYATYNSGQKSNTYNTIISGPRQENEKDGPGEMYVVLLDNGRSNVLAQKFQRRALSCIECGACQNVCPVYRKIGGDAYNTTYTGPIGSVITPWMKGMVEYNHLSYLSTLCSECTEVCPVMINLHEQLLYNRNDAIKMKIRSFSESMVMEGWHQVLKSRKWMDWASSGWKNRILKKLYARKFGNEKQMPLFSNKSFKQLWEFRREGKS